MKLPFYWIDAFASRAFTGNPAGVVPLAEWIPDALMQNIAFENGLPMTAFFVRQDTYRFHLRWFHTDREADICGHATVATAFTLFTELGQGGNRVDFETRAGPIAVTRGATDGRLELNFPSRPASPAALPNHSALLRALGGTVSELLQIPGREYFMAVYQRAEDVRTLRPDMAALAALGETRVIVTAPGDDCDFVSRYFSPGAGLPEDAVTGSAHCTLVPYWAARLGREKLHARQLSVRGGEIWCELAGDRVRLGGHATLYLRGEISV